MLASLAPITPEEVALAKASVQNAARLSSRNPSSAGYDPIALAMQRHPGLTEAGAIEMAEELGF